MKADLIREEFLKFFQSKGHTIAPGDSLVPKDDPTLLFTGAGMNQFKEYFLGIKRDLKRAATCQKCFRTGDIDNVGRTAAHHTFFEMLGNFSFGDYFKEDAIGWAWEFLTQKLKIKKQNLWASVYMDDTEAYDIWLKTIKLPKEKIVKMGDKDNFWPSEAKQKGPNGPCGPCSEIFFDRGVKPRGGHAPLRGGKAGCGKAGCSVGCSCGRFVEVWNLVFTQFNRKEGGILEPLPMKNIDTGMGLERLAAVMQGVHTNFQTDLFAPIVEAINLLCHSFTSFRTVSEERGRGPSEEESKKEVFRRATFGGQAQDDKQYVYTIADHVRAAVFLIADGVLPSNEGRGYVERMVIRRAARCLYELGIKEPFLYKLAPVVTDIMKSFYPQLPMRRENISQILLSEEERFSQTLEDGLRILQGLMAKSGSGLISGQDAFKLYDTYGFPFDLTESIAKSKGFKVDKDGFLKAMDLQKQASRKTSVLGGEIFVKTIANTIAQLAMPTEFIGYDTLASSANIVAILRDEKPVKRIEGPDSWEVWVILDKTPFYAESGGQVGDTGKIIKGQRSKVKGQREDAVELNVLDTKKFDQVIVHICKIKKGSIKVGDKVIAQIDGQRRLDIARNHTATHLLHSALRKVLGEHAHQAGSLVAQDRLRFDFTHFKALSDSQLGRIEEIVNSGIQQNNKVIASVMDLKEAISCGATALFNEKYQDKVRVVSAGDYSKELCGGAHIENTGQIESFKIISEASISAGVRRIEAVTGRYALDIEQRQRDILEELSVVFGVKKEELPEHLVFLQEKIKRLESALAKARLNMAVRQAQGFALTASQEPDKLKIIAREIEGADAPILRAMVDAIRKNAHKTAVLLAARSVDKVAIIAAFSGDLVKAGLDASVIIKDAVSIAQGTGGGRADMAQAGLRRPEKLKDVLGRFGKLVTEALK